MPSFASSTSQETPLYPVVVIGTRAQLIKMAPVLRELEDRQAPFRLVFTGQHLVTMQSLLDDFAIRTEPDWLGQKSEVQTLGRMFTWFLASLWRLTLTRRQLLRSPDNRRGLIVVHGDTASTLLGALAGRLNGCRVAHVESGLRSFSWKDPFPEELTRLLVFRLIEIAYCPGPWAKGNMDRYRVTAVDTGSNTLLDAVRFAVSSPACSDTELTKPSRCVVSIHRFENLRSRKRMDWLLDTICDIARVYEVDFVLHPSTRSRLEQTGDLAKLQRSPAITLHNRMGYLAFIKKIANSDFVLTDGGSNQEELSYLGIPTLIARERSERLEGLQANAELYLIEQSSDWKSCLENIKQRIGKTKREFPPGSPSKVIVDHILALNVE